MTPQAAGVLLFDENGKILLVKHNDGSGRHSLPGGAVEPGEAPPDAAIREAREKIGVDVALQGLLGIYKTVGGEKPDRYVYVFTAEVLAGTIGIADPNEIHSLHWINLSAPPFPLTNEILPVLEDLQEGRSGVFKTVQRYS